MSVPIGIPRLARGGTEERCREGLADRHLDEEEGEVAQPPFRQRSDPAAQRFVVHHAVRYFAKVVHHRTTVKNRLHAVLAQRMIVPDERLFSKAGYQLLRTLELDVVGRQLVDSDLRQLEQVEREIAALDESIAKLAQGDELAKLLMTLPGFDFGGAVGVVAGAGDMERFPDGNHFASYFGLVPSTKQSAETTYHGPITKAGRAR